MAIIGQGLINLFTPILRLINTFLVKILTLATACKSLTELLTGKKETRGSGIGTASQETSELYGGLTDAGQPARGLGQATASVVSLPKKPLRK